MGQTLDYHARLYDPHLGRFIQPDSIVPDPFNPQALNRYSYVLNNPLKYVDPMGHVNVLSWFFNTVIQPAWNFFNNHVVQPIYNNIIQPVVNFFASPFTTPSATISPPIGVSPAQGQGGVQSQATTRNQASTEANGDPGNDYGLVRPDGHPFVFGREGSKVIAEGSPTGQFIEDNIFFGHSIGTRHDELVDGLKANGVPDLLANYPTMIPWAAYAVVLETFNVPITLVNRGIDLYNATFDAHIPPLQPIFPHTHPDGIR